ncbi:MAG TPA: hypothetical protein VJU77_01495, partial [Chthoniobacterales bacterium]|nr:hypothetical protein [Chthoniobacterales bacterium]
MNQRTVSLLRPAKIFLPALSLILAGQLSLALAETDPISPDNGFLPPTFAKAATPGRALLLSDGKYLLYFGMDTLTDQTTGALTRFMPDGTLDSSFSFSRDYKEVVAATAAADGKLYVAAARYAYGVLEREEILRLNTDGSIDSSFAPDLVGNPDPFPVVQQIVVQPDGRILVVGGFHTFAGNDARDGIVRLMPDGTVDPSFAPVTINNFVYAATVQADGKIVIGGSFTTVNGVTKTSKVARLNANGSLDSSPFFGSDFSTPGRVRAIVIQPDGSTLLSGSFRFGSNPNSPRLPVIRLNGVGLFDSSFNSAGVVQTFNTGRDLGLQPDGKILAVINNSVYRLNSDGTNDTAFRQPVLEDATATPPTTLGTPVTLQLYSDGRMLVGGAFTDVAPLATPTYAHFGAVRLNSDGNVDTTFTTSRRTGNERAPSSFVRLDDGSTLVTFDDPIDPPIAYNVARLLGNGTRDPNFALSSSDPSRFLTGFSARTIKPLPDGKFFVNGVQAEGYPIYGKVDENGVEDTTFLIGQGVGGDDITIGPDGKIWFAAGEDPQMTLFGSGARLTVNGDLVNNGAPIQSQIERSGGMLFTLYVGTRYIAIRPDGNALLQYFSSDLKFHLFGFIGDGALPEVTFSAPDAAATSFPFVLDPAIGTTVQPPNGAWSATRAVQGAHIQPDGRIILVGHFTAYGDTPARGIIRIESSGTVDSTFNAGNGMQWTSITETASFFPSIENIEPTTDGKFLITGNFEAFNGTAAPGITQLNADGSVDTSFVAPVHRDKRSRMASAFHAQPDGSFLLSGPYIVNGETEPRSLIRLLGLAPNVGNISTRLVVGTDDNVLIEGFIVQGPAGSSKKILVRAIGPSLAQFGVPGALANPTLEIHDASGATVATNNDWKTTQIGGLIPGNQFTEINGSGLAPSSDLESAIIANLEPGSYTAVVRGAGNTVGTGVVDAFDLSSASPARLANIATRGLVQPGDGLMIAGFIV